MIEFDGEHGAFVDTDTAVVAGKWIDDEEAKKAICLGQCSGGA
jgi:hypothetical protein